MIRAHDVGAVGGSMHPFFDLTGRVALVTGGGGVIGGATARALARAGADVAVVDLRVEAATSVADDVIALGRRALAIGADAADFDASARALAEAEALGPIDVLVCVAGGGQPKGILAMSPEEFDDVQRRNLRSAWNWSKLVAPGMVTRSGQRIIYISSMSAKYGGGPPYSVSRSAYAAAKAGVLGLARGLAKELAPNVTVNAVCPGLIETANTRFIAQGPQREALLAAILKGRPGVGDDVAAAVTFFASPGADWITGEVMDVNGGQYLD
jgi:3-oxoacyl-[acyl-carrier protein] reductase